MHPISFGIPEEKIVDDVPAKTKDFPEHIVDAEVASRIGHSTSYAFADEAAYYEEIYRLAISDPLTGVYNKRYLLELLERELGRSARYRRPLAVVMLDIDHFKRVNDAHGHQSGDLVLKAIAVALGECIRPMDTVARFGGEEFAMILPNCPPSYGQAVAERIRSHVSASPIGLGGGDEVRVTVSIGGAFAPQWVR